MSIPTRDDFLSECLARPDDMTARVVFADWLEEQGQSKEADQWREEAANPIDMHGVSNLNHIIRTVGNNMPLSRDMIRLNAPDRGDFPMHLDALLFHGYLRVRDEPHFIPMSPGRYTAMALYELTDLGRVVLAAWELERATSR